MSFFSHSAHGRPDPLSPAVRNTRAFSDIHVDAETLMSFLPNLSPLSLNPHDRTLLWRVFHALAQGITEPEFGIVDICDAACLTRTQVFRRLKSLTGLNPTLLIRYIRLAMARQLLLETELTVAEVAYDVGFSDPNYFSRAFHQEFYQRPTDLRVA